jgi:hypothetical protein
MMIRYVLTGSALFFGLATAMSGCSSARTVCELMCECEHCSDPREDVTCAEYEAQEAAVEAYECSEQWEALMTCIQEKGTCDEKESNFSTRGNGNCNDTQDLGTPCTTNADCPSAGFPVPPTCSNGMCVLTSCEDSGTPCSSNDDCKGEGPDLCDDEEQDLGECVDAASGGAGPNF